MTEHFILSCQKKGTVQKRFSVAQSSNYQHSGMSQEILFFSLINSVTRIQYPSLKSYMTCLWNCKKKTNLTLSQKISLYNFWIKFADTDRFLPSVIYCIHSFPYLKNSHYNLPLNSNSCLCQQSKFFQQEKEINILLYVFKN